MMWLMPVDLWLVLLLVLQHLVQSRSFQCPPLVVGFWLVGLVLLLVVLWLVVLS
jgi:hypothetical protein